MGMSTNIKGFIPDTDSTYLKHLAVLQACLAAGIKKLPKETAEYFDSERPEEYLIEEKLEVDIPSRPYSDGGSEGYEIIVSEIPKGVHKIRFYNSW